MLLTDLQAAAAQTETASDKQKDTSKTCEPSLILHLNGQLIDTVAATPQTSKTPASKNQKLSAKEVKTLNEKMRKRLHKTSGKI